ncbi:hypothetical protein SAMN02745784_00357 [Tissierella praeacuta DSM 18095]|uniref:Uncharacterized protein n=1 Tax=Tissierella praeacuta DSM 18095 TaxID=1123404 RepID=A0A1M4SJS6_9FIRM|nr:hypothetical protein [Tissierella praeacuta]SHE32451.1 hypothetical protein SAMN02745784_00357 [Tissierella praeacuta DSM 18095]SUP01496.1 Uncharacterised protein [Tissierella praeacuta]
MSIKPIDYNVMLPKTQEVSSAKYIENVKNRNIVESGFVQQEKTINKNKKKVMNTEKSNKSRIYDNNSSKKQKNSQDNKRKKSEESSSEDIPKNIGNKIDIRI